MLQTILLTAALMSAQAPPPLSDADRDAIPAVVEEVTAYGLEEGVPNAPIAGAYLRAAGLDEWVFLLLTVSDWGEPTRVRFAVSIDGGPPYDLLPLLGYAAPYVNSTGTAVSFLFTFPKSAIGDESTWSIAFAFGGQTGPLRKAFLALHVGESECLIGHEKKTPHSLRALDLESGRSLCLAIRQRRGPPPPEMKECEQGLHQMQGPLYMIIREECVFEPGRTCVPDCGDMIGKMVFNLDEMWG